MRMKSNGNITDCLVVVFAAAVVALAPGLAIAQDELPRITLEQCPAVVQKALAAEARGAKIKDVEVDTEADEPEYTAHVTLNKRKYAITVATGGKLMEKVLESEKTDVAFKDCPKAVQKAMADEAAGVEIKKVEKEVLNGVVSYAAKVTITKDVYHVTVSENGVLLEKWYDDSDPDNSDDAGSHQMVKVGQGGNASVALAR